MNGINAILDHELPKTDINTGGQSSIKSGLYSNMVLVTRQRWLGRSSQPLTSAHVCCNICSRGVMRDWRRLRALITILWRVSSSFSVQFALREVRFSIKPGTASASLGRVASERSTVVDMLAVCTCYVLLKLGKWGRGRRARWGRCIPLLIWTIRLAYPSSRERRQAFP